MLPKKKDNNRNVQFLMRMSPEVKQWLERQQKASEYKTLSAYIDDFFVAVISNEKAVKRALNGKKT